VNEKEIKEQYYYMTIHDYKTGTDLLQLEKILKFYEKLEMYYQCAGIYKAIEEIKIIELIKLTKLIRQINGRTNSGKI
tara:strand:+ start:3102 stop:3335 length:234 start_codon:yes stop_codon:yes gene_type:complete